jgi:hypothetical protein
MPWQDLIWTPPAMTSVHDLGLALQLMQDIGWTLAPQFGTDIVFLMDVTGSTGALMPNWLAQIPAIAQAWKDFDPNALCRREPCRSPVLRPASVAPVLQHMSRPMASHPRYPLVCHRARVSPFSARNVPLFVR